MAAKEKINLLEVIPCRYKEALHPRIFKTGKGEHNRLPFPFCCNMFTATGNDL